MTCKCQCKSVRKFSFCNLHIVLEIGSTYAMMKFHILKILQKPYCSNLMHYSFAI